MLGNEQLTLSEGRVYTMLFIVSDYTIFTLPINFTKNLSGLLHWQIAVEESISIR